MPISTYRRKKLYRQGCQANGLHHEDCDGSANNVHHVRPLSYYGSNDESNLLPVNRLCHDLIHLPVNEQKAIDLGLLIIDIADIALDQDRAIIKRHKEAIAAAKDRLRESLR